MTGEAWRYAVYFTPAHGSPLDRFGAALLGYDAYTGRSIPQVGWPGVDDRALDAITAEPRRYGFHATLKAPFRLAEGCTPTALAEAVRSLATSHAVVPLGHLRPVLLGSFVALVPVVEAPGLDPLAAACVTTFDGFRAPLDERDRARRRSAGLSARQTELLERWGYPHVFEEFRFHMTLTGPLPPAEQEPWFRRLSSAFEPIAQADVVVDAITLLRQEAGAPFRVIERFPLKGENDGR